MKAICYIFCQFKDQILERYKNVQKNPNMKISVDGQEITGKARPITDVNKVKEVTEKFRSKIW
jgi:hypothetical protein